MKLAKLGYCGGDPSVILKTPVNIVIGMLDFEAFNDDYETSYIALNKED